MNIRGSKRYSRIVTSCSRVKRSLLHLVGGHHHSERFAIIPLEAELIFFDMPRVA